MIDDAAVILNGHAEYNIPKPGVAAQNAFDYIRLIDQSRTRSFTIPSERTISAGGQPETKTYGLFVFRVERVRTEL